MKPKQTSQDPPHVIISYENLDLADFFFLRSNIIKLETNPKEIINRLPSNHIHTTDLDPIISIFPEVVS